MIRNRTNVLLVSLAISTALNAGTANAADHRFWREQVARSVDSAIKLEWKTVDPKKRVGNDSLLWREQVKVASKNRVFVFEPTPQRSARSSDWRLWREQIKSGSAGNKHRMVSNSLRSNKISNQ